MEKEFIEYEQALALKELGFDEPCFAFYDESLYFPNNENQYGTFCNQKLDVSSCSAPTFSQAFRWFREKYNIRHNIMDFIDDEVGIEWDYEIAIIGTDIDEKGNYKPLIDYSTDDEDRKFKTYEEAELECLKKLIEIVKKQKEDESNIIV